MSCIPIQSDNKISEIFILLAYYQGSGLVSIAGLHCVRPLVITADLLLNRCRITYPVTHYQVMSISCIWEQIFKVQKVNQSLIL